MSTGRVDGKSVIVTGAAKGIGAICFLASDAASFITGVGLPVDDGYLAR